MEVPADWMKVFLSHSLHPVHELEVLPVCVSFWLWARSGISVMPRSFTIQITILVDLH